MSSSMVDCSDASSSSGRSSSPGPQTPSRVASPQLRISDMTSLILHSPNDQIVGTPFATNCGGAPFEYPFPMATSPISASSSLGQVCPTPAMGPASSNSSRPPSPGVPLPPPVLATSSILSDPATTIALSLAMGVPGSSSGDASSPGTSLATLHGHLQKMRMASAPVPPGLIKRRKERAGTANGVINGSTGSTTSGRRGSHGSNSPLLKPQRPLMADTGMRLSNTS